MSSRRRHATTVHQAPCPCAFRNLTEKPFSAQAIISRKRKLYIKLFPPSSVSWEGVAQHHRCFSPWVFASSIPTWALLHEMAQRYHMGARLLMMYWLACQMMPREIIKEIWQWLYPPPPDL